MLSQYTKRVRWVRIALLALLALLSGVIIWGPRNFVSSLADFQFARIVLAFGIAAVSIGVILWPDYFFGVKGCFCISARRLPRGEAERLERALTAREDAEAIPGRANLRYFAIVGVALAALELSPALPAVLPYSLFCLAFAIEMLVAYLRFRRATERRVAPLVRRSVLTALPLPAIAAMACCLAGELAFMTYPPQRFGSIVIAVATVVLGAIAWRVAVAPALLVGADPDVEYIIDERLRKVRAISIAVLACGVGTLFASIGIVHIPSQYGYLRIVELAIMYVTMVPLILNVVVSRRPLAFA